MGDTSVEWTPAYFSPDLASERNGWVLNRLRQYSIHSVLDIGCGDGTLLRSLCEPSSERYDPRTPLDPTTSCRPIYTTAVGGLDIDERSIRSAVERTKFAEFDPERDRFSSDNGRIRWDGVDVSLWHGGIESVNSEWVDKYECFVSTEVVEHLPSPILSLFLPLVLSYYRPRYLLLTTPNYLTNALFSPPGAPNDEGFPDPTGETGRIFRHHDHKREWTPDEWKKWCEDGAREYGYDVEVGAVGWLGRRDPFGRKQEGGGTLTAVFVRREGDDRERVLPSSISSPSSSPPHTLVSHQVLAAHPSSGAPSSPSTILERIRDVFRASPSDELQVDFLWTTNDIDIACGGLIQSLLDALLAPPIFTPGEALPKLEWQITQGAPYDLSSWFVQWLDWSPPPLDAASSFDRYPTDRDLWDGTADEDEYDWPEAKAAVGGSSDVPAEWTDAASSEGWGWDSGPTSTPSTTLDWEAGTENGVGVEGDDSKKVELLWGESSSSAFRTTGHDFWSAPIAAPESSANDTNKGRST